MLCGISFSTLARNPAVVTFNWILFSYLLKKCALFAWKIITPNGGKLSHLENQSRCPLYCGIFFSIQTYFLEFLRNSFLSMRLSVGLDLKAIPPSF